MPKTNIFTQEAELVEALRNREEKAFRFLHDHYAANLYGVILKLVRNHLLAEDLLQEVFIRVWVHIQDYDATKGRLFTWLLNITRNLAIDQLRSLAHRESGRTVSLDKQHSSASLSHSQPAMPELAVLFRHLREEERILVEMLYFQGYTRTEAALVLGLPVGTVKTRIRRAIQKLKKCFPAQE